MREASRAGSGVGAVLSVAPDHLRRAVRRGRPGRYRGPHPSRTDAGIARPAHPHRERDRCLGHDRGRPRRARRARRLHGERRQLAVARRQWRDLHVAVRCPEGFRACRTPLPQSLCRRGEKEPAGEQPQGAHCLAQGQSGQGHRGHRRAWGWSARQRSLFPEGHRDAFPVRALSRRLDRHRARLGGMRDLVAGHIDLTFDQAVTALPHVRNGAVKAYAVTSPTRLAAAPEIPSVDEVGAPGVYISTWYGLWVPSGTPPEIVHKLTSAAMDALDDPTVRQRLTDLGQEIPPREQQTAEALAAFHKAEIEKWWPLIRGAGIKAQ